MYGNDHDTLYIVMIEWYNIDSNVMITLGLLRGMSETESSSPGCRRDSCLIVDAMIGHIDRLCRPIVKGDVVGEQLHRIDH